MTQLDLNFAAAGPKSHQVPTLADLLRGQALEPIDVHFARTVTRTLGAPGDALLELGAAAVSRAHRAGHVCLELAGDLRLELVGEDGEVLVTPLPSVSQVAQALLDASAASLADGPSAPFVVDLDRVYLHRSWEHERRVAHELARRAALPPEPLSNRRRELLGRLFPEDTVGDAPNWQKVAAAVAWTRPLSVITGGPGTGKTSTVVRVLAGLIEDSPGGVPRISLLAPTGKAAARMSEAIAAARDNLPVQDAVKDALPTEASTIHRALRPMRAGGFRRGPDNPIPADVVVVDEASMIDLALMRHLLEAIPAHTRVILLGDRHQLASVEAGAVLGDLCGPTASHVAASVGLLTTQVCGRSVPMRSRQTAIADCVVELRHSYRFAGEGGIGKLSRAVVAGDADRVEELLRAGDRHVAWVDPAGADGTLEELALEGYAPLVAAASSPEVDLSVLRAFRVLCAHRRGSRGVERLGAQIEAGLLQQAGRPVDSLFYPGRPVLVTDNDHHLGLWNGDVGLTVSTHHGRRVAFPQGVGARLVAPARLPAHESVYAMSVHKSQGSEFDRVVLVLPEHASRVLTRELLYTAITRAREHVTVYGSMDLIRHATTTAVARASGLGVRLWGP